MRRKRYPFKAMGSPCEIQLYGVEAGALDAAARLAIAELARIERKYTRFRDDSLTAEINRSAGNAAGLSVDAETAALLDYAHAAYEQSGGLFDITSGVLRRVWDFKSGRVPSQAQIDAVLEVVGWPHVDWDGERITLPLAGMQLDLGGYVKEYAADRAAELCVQRGVRHGLVDLGGDLAVIGPHPDGSGWQVGIRHPRQPGAIASFTLEAGGLATSGDYERCMIVDGVRYGHILDPTTGWPVEGLLSASVAASHCLVAGTASTVAMLKGADGGVEWLEALELPNLWVAHDGRVGGTGFGRKGSPRPTPASSGRCERSGRSDHVS